MEVDDVAVGLRNQIRVLQLDYAVYELCAGNDRGGLRIVVQNRFADQLYLGRRVVQEVDSAADVGRAENIGRGPGLIREERIRRQLAVRRHVLGMLILTVFDLLQTVAGAERRRADRIQ